MKAFSARWWKHKSLVSINNWSNHLAALSLEDKLEGELAPTDSLIFYEVALYLGLFQRTGFPSLFGKTILYK